MKCNNRECNPECNRCEEAAPVTVIDAEFINTVQQTAQVLVRTAAEINNAIRLIERECPHADDKVILSAIRRLSNTAGDASQQWAELDLTIAGYDMLDPR